MSSQDNAATLIYCVKRNADSVKSYCVWIESKWKIRSDQVSVSEKDENVVGKQQQSAMSMIKLDVCVAVH